MPQQVPCAVAARAATGKGTESVTSKDTEGLALIPIGGRCNACGNRPCTCKPKKC
ncbi:hypothetical protein Abr02nite_18150 [Paractinoplanes brasiliensis]|nr:hypothetical protein Abr02nite_18150 [Actinoplanes brasiliensis]